MFETDKFTRTGETEAAYIKQASNLLEKYAETTGKDWDLDLEGLVEWLQQRRDGCSPAYWGRLRSALVYYFRIYGNPSLSESVRAISKDGCPPPTKTSARKKKSVSDSELVELTNYLLGEGGTKISRETYNFFVSGIMTGMRPCEWSQSVLKIIVDSAEYGLQYFGGIENVDAEKVDGLRIVVQNAKATNGRAHGDSRTLSFLNLTPKEIDVLLDHWRSVERECRSGTFPLFQRQCSDKLRYAGHKLWPSKRKRISLYSGRHQSMANGKASNLPPKVIAAMHGHATDRTAGEHYGRKQFGVAGRVYMEVPEEEIARVREIPSNWNPPGREKDTAHKKSEDIKR